MDRQGSPKGPERMSGAVLATVVVAVLCCALPLVLAALGLGALSGAAARIGGLGWPLASGLAVAVAALVYGGTRGVRRRIAGKAPAAKKVRG